MKAIGHLGASADRALCLRHRACSPGPTGNDPWCLRREALRASPAALRLAPPGGCKPLRGMQRNSRDQCWLSAARSSQQELRATRGAASLAAVFLSSRLFLRTVTPCAQSSRVRFAQVLAVLTRSLRFATGCGFRAAPACPLTPVLFARGYQSAGRDDRNTATKRADRRIRPLQKPGGTGTRNPGAKRLRQRPRWAAKPGGLRTE
jgi:hypothetical protein